MAARILQKLCLALLVLTIATNGQENETTIAEEMTTTDALTTTAALKTTIKLPTTTAETTTKGRSQTATCSCWFGSTRRLNQYNVGVHKIYIDDLIPSTTISSSSCTLIDQLCKSHCAAEAKINQLDITGAGTKIVNGDTLGNRMCGSVSRGYTLGPDLGIYYSVDICLASQTSYATQLVHIVDKNFCCQLSYKFGQYREYTPCFVATSTAKPVTTITPKPSPKLTSANGTVQTDRCQCNLTLVSGEATNTWPLYKVFRNDLQAKSYYAINYTSAAPDCDKAHQECEDVCNALGRKYFQRGLKTWLTWHTKSTFHSSAAPKSNYLDEFACDMLGRTVSQAMTVAVTQRTNSCYANTRTSGHVSDEKLCCRRSFSGISLSSAYSYSPTTCITQPRWTDVFG